MTPARLCSENSVVVLTAAIPIEIPAAAVMRVDPASLPAAKTEKGLADFDTIVSSLQSACRSSQVRRNQRETACTWCRQCGSSL